jgi:hypothetical protein
MDAEGRWLVLAQLRRPIHRLIATVRAYPAES